jgi:hypothetical protein
MKLLTALKSKKVETGGSGKAAEKLLGSVVIAAPCPLSWDSMVGDDKVRHCGGCSKNVYNLSAMTEKEAESFLQVNGATQCMRFYRRADGTIMSDNCPMGLRKIRDRVRNIGRMAAGFVALVLAFPSASAQSGEVKMLRGKPAINRSPATTIPPRIPSYAAGGPMLLQPIEPTAHQGDVAFPEPQTTRPVIMGEPPLQIDITPVKTVKTPKKDPKANKDPDGDNGYYKLYAEFNRFADETALNFYKKAKEMEKKSNLEMAEFYYEKALEEIETHEKNNGNSGHDPAFRKLIEGQIKDLQDKKKPIVYTR